MMRALLSSRLLSQLPCLETGQHFRAKRPRPMRVQFCVPVTQAGTQAFWTQGYDWGLRGLSMRWTRTGP